MNDIPRAMKQPRKLVVSFDFDVRTFTLFGIHLSKRQNLEQKSDSNRPGRSPTTSGPTPLPPDSDTSPSQEPFSFGPTRHPFGPQELGHPIRIRDFRTQNHSNEMYCGSSLRVLVPQLYTSLLVSSTRGTPDYPMNAAEILAGHLHGRTYPDELNRILLSAEDGLEASRIPIHCVAVHARGKIESISSWNDQLKSRFPSGIEHIICWNDSNVTHQSCFATIDVDGSIISKQICTSWDNHGLELWIHATKHMIYYQDVCIPEWEAYDPAWTQVLTCEPSPSETQDILPWTTMKPPGMYWHELRKYQGLPGLSGDGSMLVWKSYRSRNELREHPMSGRLYQVHPTPHTIFENAAGNLGIDFRFRVQTALPLEPVKAWHVISPELDIKSIEDLTTNIIQALGLAEVEGEISLELDEFTLLPSSPAGVVRDGDIVTVRCKSRPDKRKATEDQPTKKQKTQSPGPTPSSAFALPASSAKQLPKLSEPLRPAPATRLVAGPSKTAPSSSEDDSSTDSDSSSEDDSESSSESTDDSDSDSDSSSDSDSDSDDGPTPQPISRQSVPSARQTSVSKVSVAPARTTPSQPPVPPGQGKPSTKNRNARRRALRKHVAAGTVMSPRATPTLTRATTTPTPAPAVENVIATQVKASTPIAPAKNANKNKRKGFDKDMAGAVATKITYGTPAPTSVSVEPPLARTSSPAVPTAQAKSRYTHYHVLPPSQLKDLPSNVIVTSVDVEAVDGMEGVGKWFDGGNRVAEEDETAANENPQPKTNDTSKKIDWEVVDSEWERLWDSFPAIGQEVWNNLQAGTLLAYLNLTIDSVTCTPCSKIHLARVVSGPSSGGGAECFFIERPGAGDVGFGFGAKFGAASEEQDNTEDDEFGETRSVAFEEVREWKMIP